MKWATLIPYKFTETQSILKIYDNLDVKTK
jgi:hypothetical protein